MNKPLKAPFPYFGGKSRVAEEVWKRFGDVKSYIEPFCGSMAVLLHKEVPVSYETVNDLDGLLTNFWRAIKFDPEGVADLAEAPSSEIDLTARHNWVFDRKERITKMQEDPKYYDVEAAAYWVYVRSSMIGSRLMFESRIGSRIPILGWPCGIHSGERKNNLIPIFNQLSSRLSKVTICCGEWGRVFTGKTLECNLPVGIFLDPPYQVGEFDSGVFEHSTDVFSKVKEWCIENGNNPDLRIALCGYDGNEMPSDWTTYEWSTGGGYGRISKGGSTKGGENRFKERIWFSPHCLSPDKSLGILDMFKGPEDSSQSEE